jgi:hypothetical protein
MMFSDDVTVTQENLNSWKTETLHGNFLHSLQGNHLQNESSLLWLSAGYVYPESEGFAVAIQDQVIKTRNYEKHYLRVDVSDRHWKCSKVGVTIEHTVPGCSLLSESA